MSDVQQILVPDVGGDEVEVIEVLVAVGDSLEAEDGIVTAVSYTHLTLPTKRIV